MTIGVLFVCLGNICRSPMAEGIFKKLISDAKLDAHFVVDSAGTSGYHAGELPDRRMRMTAEKEGIVLTHKARRVMRNDLDEFHYVLAMDRVNFHDLQLLHPNPGAQVMLLRSFGQGPEQDVPDPYYGTDQGFKEVFDILEFHSKELLLYLKDMHGL